MVIWINKSLLSKRKYLPGSKESVSIGSNNKVVKKLIEGKKLERTTGNVGPSNIGISKVTFKIRSGIISRFGVPVPCNGTLERSLINELVSKSNMRPVMKA